MAEQLQNNPRANPELAKQAGELAQKQKQIAEKIQQLSQQSGAENAAREQRQGELSDATKQLEKQLADLENHLGQEPFNQTQPAKEAEQAGKEVASSQPKMKAAKEASQQGNPNKAADFAKQAADDLQRAAENTQAAAERNQPPQSPIPPGVGKEIAKAVRNLRQPQQTPAPSKVGQPQPDAQSDQLSQPGQEGSGEGQAPGSPFAGLAKSLREAARALSDAANQSAPLPSQAGQSQPGQPSKDNAQVAQGGGNGEGNMEQDKGENLADLQSQLKKMTGRNWGQLSSKLKTELSQQAKHQAHGDYSKLIKLYFQEIAKTQPDTAEGKR